MDITRLLVAPFRTSFSFLRVFDTVELESSLDLRFFSCSSPLGERAREREKTANFLFLFQTRRRSRLLLLLFYFEMKNKKDRLISSAFITISRPGAERYAGRGEVFARAQSIDPRRRLLGQQRTRLLLPVGRQLHSGRMQCVATAVFVGIIHSSFIDDLRPLNCIVDIRAFLLSLAIVPLAFSSSSSSSM